MNSILFRGLLALALLLMAEAAAAQTCTINASQLNFGTQTSPTPQVDSTASLTLRCTSASAGSRRVCVDASATTDTMGTIAYTLSSSASGSPLWTPQEYTVTYNTDKVVTVYGRVASGQSAASGTYTASNLIFTMRAPAGNSPCANGTGSNLSSKALSSKIVIANSCTIGTSPIGFGTLSSLAANVDASGNLSINCNSGAGYTVELDGGTTTGSVSNRMMSLGGIGAGVISYQLYQDSARLVVWGNTGPATVTGTGTGSSQTLTVYARIPSQATPAVGNYKDTVTATVTF